MQSQEIYLMKQGEGFLEAPYTLKETANSFKFTVATVQFLVYSGDLANSSLEVIDISLSPTDRNFDCLKAFTSTVCNSCSHV